MDDYVSAFPATHHGYRIRIGKSQKKSSPVAHYDCYRGGYPSLGSTEAGTTKSARIGCPFKLSTRYLYDSASWILTHTHLGHNHPPDPNVKPRKKYKDPKDLPILAPGVVLDEIDNGSAANPEEPLDFNHPITNDAIALPETPILTSPAQTYDDIKEDLNTLDSIEATVSQLRAQLCAMVPHRRQDVLTQIQSIIQHAAMINDERSLPISFLPEAPQPTLLYDMVIQTQNSTHDEVGPALEEGYPGDSLLEAMEVTTSTFNVEDLIITQPTLQAPQPMDTANQSAPDHVTTYLSPASPPQISLVSQNPAEPLSHAATTVAPLPSPPAAFVPSDPGNTPSSLSEPTKPSTSSPPLTRKRALEAALSQKPNLINPNLPALMAKYRLHSWLEPFVIDIREVKGDGHCGFRAIAISIGKSQDKWQSIRQQMADTVTNMEDDRPLPENRADALARLAITKPNVVTDQQHWLGMPSWGGVIANAFNRPVLYYEPGSYSQIVFPYSTAYNMNPPIVLAFADHHFTSLLLDFTRPNFPAPRLCATWRRFHTPKASGWSDAWQPLIDSHAEFLKSLNKNRRKKKNPICIHVS
ncbi:uncharacterized protein MELLADRAFT_105260 [Melampsora larici-populina 98AG31]|uniref:OTU domain-containing protein n=1 Tax=Melampsora larici-populina (strain 98AG31 / pathotype 3-4-7) TaxID=747676 RepID=F4RHD6_MELLP|nr:uncharacterized protein MELLADRAFT_105260 [Melampsora larici-populina 98AG31]EGG08266.1 hypothetical protein MELLADRAFT_105260 [Melampsora larici-populina 98AG31]